MRAEFGVALLSVSPALLVIEERNRSALILSTSSAISLLLGRRPELISPPTDNVATSKLAGAFLSGFASAPPPLVVFSGIAMLNLLSPRVIESRLGWHRSDEVSGGATSKEFEEENVKERPARKLCRCD